MAEPLPEGFTIDTPQAPISGGGGPPSGFTVDQPDYTPPSSPQSTTRDDMTRMMPARERVVYSMGQGLVDMGVGLAQHVLPESVQTSAPFQAVKGWAEAPTSDPGQKGGRIVGPMFAPTGAIGKAASSIPGVARAGSWLAQHVPAWIRSGVAGGATAGLTAAPNTTSPSEAWKSSLWPAVVGTGVGGVLGSIGRSPVSQAFQQYNIRQTPGQMMPFPGVGGFIERAASHVPGARAAVGMGLKTTRDDAQRALYEHALEPIRSLNIPGTGIASPTAVGREGLKQLRDNIGNRFNSILNQAELRATPQLLQSLQQVQRANLRNLSSDDIRRFQNVLRDDVIGPMQNNRGLLPGSRLAGKGGVVGKVREQMRNAYQSGNAALGDAYRSLHDAIINNANFGGAQGANSPYGQMVKQEYQATAQAYARWGDLDRAARGDRGGFVSPGRLAGAKNAYPGLRDMAETLREGGVPDVGKGGSVMPAHGLAELLSGAGLGALTPYAYHDPVTAAKLAAGIGVPMALLNSPMGMSSLQWLAQQAPSAIGARAGGVAGKAQPPR